MQAGLGPHGGGEAVMARQAGRKGGGVTGPGGPSGIEPARSRVRAEVFCQWPTRLDSAGVCVCKATGHARAS
jgi:hypothetical protein